MGGSSRIHNSAPQQIDHLTPKRQGPIAAVPEWKLRDKTILENVSGTLSSVSDFWGPVVLIDFLLGLSTIFVSYLLPGGFPGGVATASLLILIGLRRRGRLRQRSAGMWIGLVAVLFLFLAVESHANGMPYLQREFKFGVFVGFCFVIATGRVDVRSLIMGGMSAALINVPMFYAGLTPNAYPPYLTGFYGDKNISGLYYALWAVLGLMVLRTRKMQVLWFVGALGLLFLTGSRTSMFGALLALTWILLRNRVGLGGRIGLVIAGYLIAGPVQNKFAENSLYGNRTGTDWFREQIEIAMQAKADITPWYGLGLNQGTVVLKGGDTMFFHNSYLQAFVEGGYPLVAFFVAVFGVVGLGVFVPAHRVPQQLAIAQGACIVVLICAWKLGEVFITFGAFMALGIACAFAYGQMKSDEELDDAEDQLPPSYAQLRAAQRRAQAEEASRSETLASR